MDTFTKLSLFRNAVYDAFQADDRTTYEELVRKLLDFTALVSHGHYGDVVHIDHVYLGLFALRRENIPLARLELLKAGMPPAGGVIRSFGPNFLLARELLRRGERQPVLDFCQRIKQFWLLPLRLYYMSGWVREIKAGKIPEFGIHLYYGMAADYFRVIRDYTRSE